MAPTETTEKPGKLEIDIAKLEAGLDALIAEQQDGGDSLKAVVRQLRPKLRKAHRRGVTYQKLTDWLSTQGVKISVSTLKTYLEEGTKPAKKPKAAAPAANPEASPKADEKTAGSQPATNGQPEEPKAQPTKTAAVSAKSQTVPPPPPTAAPTKVAEAAKPETPQRWDSPSRK